MKVIFSPLLEHHWPAIVNEFPLNHTQDTTGVVAEDADSGKVLGAVICQDWTKTSVVCHIFVKHRAVFKAKFMNEVAHYIFTTGGRLAIYAMIPSDRPKAIKLNKHLGFTEKARLEDAYDIGIDFIFMELRRENCPYWTQPVLAVAV